ncbi:MAG TPA: Uma2 family endonuclease [Polyangiaceae bacterium]|jgi:hypothetical protein|nr:Uma2 family endonuclease [Polyangiaceae bacterium]
MNFVWFTHIASTVAASDPRGKSRFCRIDKRAFPAGTNGGCRTALAADARRLIEACAEERGGEPGECYEVNGPKEFPDLAIEVVWTSGGIDKLEIYRAFGVREVWIWRDARIEVHALRGSAYERVVKSEVFADLDLAVVARGGRDACDERGPDARRA